MVMPVLDLVSRSFISSGATFEIFRLVSLGPANFLSYHSGLLAFMNVPAVSLLMENVWVIATYDPMDGVLIPFEHALSLSFWAVNVFNFDQLSKYS